MNLFSGQHRINSLKPLTQQKNTHFLLCLFCGPKEHKRKFIQVLSHVIIWQTARPCVMQEDGSNEGLKVPICRIPELIFVSDI